MLLPPKPGCAATVAWFSLPSLRWLLVMRALVDRDRRVFYEDAARRRRGPVPRRCATPWTVSTAPTPEPSVERWRGVTVAAEQRCAPYRSDEYAYPQPSRTISSQRLGGIFSPYTNEVFHSNGDTDIEHVVARSEAHDSGLCRADAATKRAFSRDLLNLTLASPRVNRDQTGAKDAAEWQPDANQCWFAADRCGRAPGLPTNDRPVEADALDGILAGCSATEMLNFR